jgi:hypothetical protein
MKQQQQEQLEEWVARSAHTYIAVEAAAEVGNWWLQGAAVSLHLALCSQPAMDGHVCVTVPAQ